MKFEPISLQKQLADNETHVQLTNLEKKWSHLEQNNFTLAEFVANRKAELNFEPVKNKGGRQNSVLPWMLYKLQRMQ